MNTRSHFGATLNRLIEERHITQVQLAKLTGIDQSIISRIIAHNKRPPDKVGRAICASWTDPKDNLRLLIDGLRDQVARWGFDPEALDIHHKTVSLPETQPEKDLETIRRHLADKNIAAMVGALADLLETGGSRKD